MTAPRRTGRTRRGSALIEFALSLGLLFPLFYGTFQYGYSFFLYNELHSAVRAGARYGSNRIYKSSTSTPAEDWTLAVKNVAVFGNPAGTGHGTIPKLTTANIDASVGFADGVPASVTVRIQDFAIDAVFQTFVLNKPAVTFPFTGVWQP